MIPHVKFQTELQVKDSMRSLVSVLSGEEYPFERLAEFADDGDPLEVRCDLSHARVRSGASGITSRFSDFFAYQNVAQGGGLGEIVTPLVQAPQPLIDFMGIERLLLKNETMNPTWSFKDRGTLPCVWLAAELGETTLATISTGTMGHSVAAYAARHGLRAIVFVPDFTPQEKILSMGAHGAVVVRVAAENFGVMTRSVLAHGEAAGLRIVSGNGPHRVEGYKLEAFEMWEQLGGEAPDYIAVPTSACGHIRGIHKGWRELFAAGLVAQVPRMIVVQAANNAPLVTGIEQGLDRMVPVEHVDTIAEAITSGNPPGGDALVRQAQSLGWPAATATEDEILDGQSRLARGGYLVEPASAVSVHAVRKLRAAGVIAPEARVVLMLTGSGLKDPTILHRHSMKIMDVNEHDLPAVMGDLAAS